MVLDKQATVFLLLIYKIFSYFLPVGFWMLRDEHSHHWTRGLDVVFQVGHLSDMIPLPTNFPTCGSWIGPDFFLV